MESLETIIMKFGGASVSKPEHFSRVADLIIAKHQIFPSIIVVVSAMGSSTDNLLLLAKKVHPDPPRREQDMLISVGERISISLLAMALARKGKEAISFTGSQSGIITCCNHAEARITDVKPKRLLSHIQRGKIVIVAGFQGVSNEGEITTLGRGGSDTSAVALGVAVKASKVEFYKDVPGIYTEDPKVNPKATMCQKLSYEQAHKIAKKDPVLHPRAINLAQKNHLPLHVLSFQKKYSKSPGTWILHHLQQKTSRQSIKENCYEESEKNS